MPYNRIHIILSIRLDDIAQFLTFKGQEPKGLFVAKQQNNPSAMPPDRQGSCDDSVWR